MSIFYIILGWNIAQHVQRARSETKCSDTPLLSNSPSFKLINEAQTKLTKHWVLSIMAELIAEIIFMLFSIYNAA